MEQLKPKDINADLGEGLTDDASWMLWISSCNISCAAHAGSQPITRQAIQAALQAKVMIGMHPSYPDPVNFGRVKMDISIVELSKSLESQIYFFMQIAHKMNAPVHHLKCHGALYHAVADEPSLSRMLIDLWRKLNLNCKIYLPPGSFLETLCLHENVPFWKEAFADRRYNANGKLAPRSDSGAVIESPEAILTQLLSLWGDQPIKSIQNTDVQISNKTICFHSDAAGSYDQMIAVMEPFKKLMKL